MTVMLSTHCGPHELRRLPRPFNIVEEGDLCVILIYYVSSGANVDRTTPPFDRAAWLHPDRHMGHQEEEHHGM